MQSYDNTDRFSLEDTLETDRPSFESLTKEIEVDEGHLNQMNVSIGLAYLLGDCEDGKEEYVKARMSALHAFPGMDVINANYNLFTEVGVLVGFQEVYGFDEIDELISNGLNDVRGPNLNLILSAERRARVSGVYSFYAKHLDLIKEKLK
ncbi:hypothetical protein CL616_04920 [archaeon]|nr:hypothetical protein [archaeon]|tara:strand:- start:439 stop:888 length:450 start_codon:yes stop_codon:yes gene_type:complete